MENNRGIKNALFYLSEQRATFDFFESYGRQYLHNLWEEEKEDANQRVEKHFKEIQRKQALCRKLRRELAQLENVLQDAEDDVNSALIDYQNSCTRRDKNHYRMALNRAKRSRNEAEDEVQSKAKQLKGKTKTSHYLRYNLNSIVLFIIFCHTHFLN